MAVDARHVDTVEHRFDLLEQRLEEMEHRIIGAFERRLQAATTAQTRTLVFSQLAAVVTIAALAFGSADPDHIVA